MNHIREEYFLESTPRVVETVEYTTTTNVGAGNQLAGMFGNHIRQPEISTQQYMINNGLIPSVQAGGFNTGTTFNSQVRENISYNTVNGYQAQNPIGFDGRSQFGTTQIGITQPQFYPPTIETNRTLNQYPLNPQTPFTNTSYPIIPPPTQSTCCCCCPTLCGNCCSLDNCFLCGCCPCVSTPPIGQTPLQANMYGVGANGATGGYGMNQYGTYERSCCFCP